MSRQNYFLTKNYSLTELLILTITKTINVCAIKNIMHYFTIDFQAYHVTTHIELSIFNSLQWEDIFQPPQYYSAIFFENNKVVRVVGDVIQ